MNGVLILRAELYSGAVLETKQFNLVYKGSISSFDWAAILKLKSI